MPKYGHVTQGYEVSPRDMGCHPRLLTYKEELRIVLKLNWSVIQEPASNDFIQKHFSRKPFIIQN